MDHREVLNIGERANFDVVGLGSHDHLGPHGDALVQANISIQFGAIVPAKRGRWWLGRWLSCIFRLSSGLQGQLNGLLAKIEAKTRTQCLLPDLVR